MLGDRNAISGNAIDAGQPLVNFYITGQRVTAAQGGLGEDLFVGLVGRQLTLARGNISFRQSFAIGGGWLQARQGVLNDFRDQFVLVGQALHVQRGTFNLYQGFPPPSLISMEARQGAIQIQKLLYFQYGDTAYISERTQPVELYHSLFFPDTDDRIAIVPNEDERTIEILEEYRGMLVAPARVGYP